MLRLIVILLIIAAVAGYFTRPEEQTMRQAADALLDQPATISEGLESLGVSLAGDRVFSDYYVATRYQVSLDGTPVVNCWGGFTQVKCDRVEDTRTGG